MSPGAERQVERSRLPRTPGKRLGNRNTGTPGAGPPRGWGKGLVTLVVTLALTACATPTLYAPAANGYGYFEQPIEFNRYRVTFNGNSVTPRQTVENYLLYRAAEFTLQTGRTHFQVVSRNTEKNTTYVSTSSGWFDYGGWYSRGYGYPSIGIGITDTQPISSYQANAEIIVMSAPEAAGDPRSYNARDVLRNLGPTIARPRPYR